MIEPTGPEPMRNRAIATRVVHHIDSGRQLEITIFAPESDSDTGDWSCGVVLQFDDGEIEKDKNCIGVDAVQAIQVAFSFIRQLLNDGYLWNQEPAFLGFPAPLPSVFGADFYREMEKLVTQEETNFVKTNRRKRD